MDVLLFLIPIALFLGAAGLVGFMWTLKSGQYEDIEGAKWRILDDSDVREDADAPESAHVPEPDPTGAREPA